MKQTKSNKLSIPLDPNPYQVTDVKGSMVTAGRSNHKSITRNSSVLKPLKFELEKGKKKEGDLVEIDFNEVPK